MAEYLAKELDPKNTPTPCQEIDKLKRYLDKLKGEEVPKQDDAGACNKEL